MLDVHYILVRSLICLFCDIFSGQRSSERFVMGPVPPLRWDFIIFENPEPSLVSSGVQYQVITKLSISFAVSSAQEVTKDRFSHSHIFGSSSCFYARLAEQIAREYYSHHTNSTPWFSVYSPSKITHVCPTYLFLTSPPGKTDDCLYTRMLGGGRRRRGHRMGFGERGEGEKFWTCVCQGGVFSSTLSL